MALRNVVQRRNHKERAQPGHRRKLGLLEKHKDYVERARDHHVKQDRIKRLQQKAALRNPDEFHFGMIKGASTSGAALQILKNHGKHIERRTTDEARPLSNDLVAILKSQDVGYLRNVARAEEKKIEQLKARILPALSLLPVRWLEEDERRQTILQQHGLLESRSLRKTSSDAIARAGKKTVWVDSVEEARSFQPLSAAAGKAKGKAKASEEEFEYALGDISDDDNDAGEMTSVQGADDTAQSEKAVGRLVHELASRQDRLNALNEARSKLDVVRQLMTTKGTSARKVGSGANDAKLRDIMTKGGRVTANGLALPGPDEEVSEGEEDAGSGTLSSAKGSKRTLWKWGRERKR